MSGNGTTVNSRTALHQLFTYIHRSRNVNMRPFHAGVLAILGLRSLGERLQE